jgi:predicted RNase H-like HicB family nuclease
MVRRFTLQYWRDGKWYVGKLQEVPGVFSQGRTLAELTDNVRDAYREMMAEEDMDAHADTQTTEIGVEV